MSDEDLSPELDAAITAMSDDLLSGKAMAVIVTPAVNQPRPDAEWMLSTMRGMIDEDGDAIGAVFAATADQAMMIPAPDGAGDPIKVLFGMRKTGVLEPIRWVAFVADTFTRHTLGITAPFDGMGASEAFKRGMPDASEALLAVCVEPDGPGYLVQQLYKRGPEGIAWSEPQPSEIGAMGVLLELMREVVLA